MSAEIDYRGIQAQVSSELPAQWYEAQSMQEAYVRGFVIVGVLNLLYKNVREGNVKRFVSFAAATLGSLADHYSTYRAFEASDRAQVEGLPRQIKEGNPLAQNIRTAREVIFSPQLHAMNMASMVSAIRSQNGVGVGANRALLAFGNMRNTKRVERTIELAREAKQNGRTEHP